MIQLFCLLLAITSAEVSAKSKKNTAQTFSKNIKKKKPNTHLKSEKQEEQILTPLQNDFNHVPFPDIKAKQILIVEEEQGLVLLERNADDLMPPSSMIKILSAQTILDMLATSHLTLNSDVIVSQEIVEEVRRQQGSTMFAEPNKPVSIYQLLQGLIIVSGNDASMALANALCGSEKVFAEHMTRKAHDMGATHTQCTNASGLPDPIMLTTCRDLVIIARSFMKKYPEHYPLFGVPTLTHNNITQSNRNPFTGWGVFHCDGIKTGYTDAAGYGVVGSCMSSDPSIKSSWRFISVMNGLTSKNERANEAKKITHWIFQHFACVDCPIRIDVPLKMASTRTGKIGANIRFVLPKGYKAAVTVQYPSYLKGAHKKGSTIGSISISSTGLKKTITQPLIVLEDIQEATGLDAIGQRLGLILASEATTISQTNETAIALG